MARGFTYHTGLIAVLCTTYLVLYMQILPHCALVILVLASVMRRRVDLCLEG